VGCAIFRHPATILPPDFRVYTSYRQISEKLLAILQGADAYRLPHGMSPPHRGIRLVQKLFRVGAMVRAGDNAGRNRDPQPPRSLEIVELAQQALAHLNPFDGADVGGEDAERVLFEAERFVDDADAVAEGGTDDREHRLLTAGNVTGPGAGSGGIEDGEAEGVAVATVGLQQLFEAAAHVAGAIEAGQFFRLLLDDGVPVGGSRGDSLGSNSGEAPEGVPPALRSGGL
jgi:hypothetical protein